MNTYYTYRNGFLEKIEIRPEETGYTPEAVQSLIRDMYGEPDSVKIGEDGVTVEGWADEIYSKYISLRLGSPCTVTVSGYSVGLTNVLASYPVEAGEAVIAQERTHRLSSACEIILDHGGNLCDNSVMFSMERK